MPHFFRINGLEACGSYASGPVTVMSTDFSHVHGFHFYVLHFDGGCLLRFHFFSEDIRLPLLQK